MRLMGFANAVVEFVEAVFMVDAPAPAPAPTPAPDAAARMASIEQENHELKHANVMLLESHAAMQKDMQENRELKAANQALREEQAAMQKGVQECLAMIPARAAIQAKMIRMEELTNAINTMIGQVKSTKANIVRLQGERDSWKKKCEEVTLAYQVSMSAEQALKRRIEDMETKHGQEMEAMKEGEKEAGRQCERGVRLLTEEWNKERKQHRDRYAGQVKLYQSLNRKWTERYAELQGRHDALVAERSVLEEKCEALEKQRVEDHKVHLTDLKFATENYKKLETERDNIRKFHRIAIEQVVKLTTRVREQTQRQEELEADLRSAKDHCDGIAKQKKFEEDLESVQRNQKKAEIKDLTEQLENTRNERDVFAEERDALKAKCDEHTSQIASLDEALGKLSQEKRDLLLALEINADKLEALQKKHANLDARTRALIEKFVRSEKQRDDAVTRLEEALQQRQDALEGQLEALKMVQKLKNGEFTDEEYDDCGEKEYDDCGEKEYEADAEYEHVREEDESDGGAVLSDRLH